MRRLSIILLRMFLAFVLVAPMGCTKAPDSMTDLQMSHNNTSNIQSLYQCPMHTHITSKDENAPCPICGMTLVPVRADSNRPQADDSLSVSPAMIQSMGVRTATAEIVALSQSLRAFGSVTANERQENTTVSRLEGWIDSLRVTAVGDNVKRGTLLFHVYSPELIAAQKDYLNSLTIGNEKRIASVRQRLKSLGLQEANIQQLSVSRTVFERIPVFAEAGGVVAQLSVREGDYVKPGTPIMSLQSYKNVWVIASIPEQDLSLIATGLSADLSFPSARNAAISGNVDYIYPTIDINTRTARVRIEVDNELGYLRPGAYADIVFNISNEARLSIPTEAILRDSRGQHVIVARGDGRFSSRTIDTGLNNGERTEVLNGLEVGERVVVSGQFMLDSEVNLREGLSKLTGADEGSLPTITDPMTNPHVDHEQ